MRGRMLERTSSAYERIVREKGKGFFDCVDKAISRVRVPLRNKINMVEQITPDRGLLEDLLRHYQPWFLAGSAILTPNAITQIAPLRWRHGRRFAACQPLHDFGLQ